LLVELSDVLAVTCECRQCKTRVSMSLDTVAVDKLRRCPSCGQLWIDDERANGTTFAHSTARLVVELRRSNAERDSLGFRLILEFAQPE